MVKSIRKLHHIYVSILEALRTKHPLFHILNILDHEFREADPSFHIRLVILRRFLPVIIENEGAEIHRWLLPEETAPPCATKRFHIRKKTDFLTCTTRHRHFPYPHHILLDIYENSTKAGVLLAGYQKESFSESFQEVLYPVLKAAAFSIETILQNYKQLRSLRRQYEETSTLYQDFFDNLPVGLYRSSPDGNILAVNRALARLLGYSDPHDVLSIRGTQLYVNPKLREKWKALLETHGMVLNFEVQYKRADGEVIWVSESTRAVRDSHGKVLFYEGVLEDITHRKKMEEASKEIFERVQHQHRVIIELLSQSELSHEPMLKVYSALAQKISELIELTSLKIFQLLEGKNLLICQYEHDFEYDAIRYGTIFEFKALEKLIHHIQLKRVALLTTQSSNEFPWIQEFMSSPSSTTLLLVPIHIHGKLFGLLTIESTQPKSYWTTDRQRFIGEIGDILAQMILDHDLHDHIQTLAVLNRVIKQARTLRKVDDLFQSTVESLIDFPHVKYVSILVEQNKRFEKTKNGEEYPSFPLPTDALEKKQTFICYEWDSTVKECKNFLKHYDISSFVAIPVPIHKKTYFLVLGRTGPIAWKESEIRILESVAQELIGGMRRIELEYAEHLRTKLMQKLIDIGEFLNIPRGVQDIYNVIGESAIDLTDADRAILLSIDENNQIFCPWLRGISREYVDFILKKIYEIPGSRLIHDPNARVIIEDVKKLPPDHIVHELSKRGGYRAFAVFPLVYEEKILAAITLYFNNPRTWHPVELEIMEAFIRQAASAFKHAQLMEDVQRLALTDPLTGLHNRYYFENLLEHAVLTAQKGDVTHALLYMDLDYFQHVNETMGYAIGNRLLKDISQYINQYKRPEYVLARMGDDDFALLMTQTELKQAVEFGQKLTRDIQSFQYTHGHHTYKGSLSIGIVMIDETTRSPAEVLSKASSACYVAKLRGGGDVHVFGPEDAEKPRMMVHELRVLGSIKKAIADDRLRLFLQPIYSLQTMTIYGYEILVRLLDEAGEIQSAYSFMNIADRFTITPLIDEWVLRKSFEMIDEYRKKFPDKLWAINISGHTLEREEMLKDLLKFIQNHPELAQQLIFEITETAAMRQLIKAEPYIRKMRELGVKFAIDDFGIGLSTFARFKQIPFDILKIDMSFVTDIVTNIVDEVLVDSIQRFATVLDIKTIAEGIETRDVLEKLIDIGVPYGQGFYLGHPEMFDTWLRMNEDDNFQTGQGLPHAPP